MISKKIRETVKQKYSGRCGYCGTRPKRLQIDHIRPVAGGGNDDIDNLMPACPPCNNLKNTFDVEQFRTEVGEQVKRARKYSVNYRTAERFGMVIDVYNGPIVFHYETY